jgi:hypothetical protein
MVSGYGWFTASSLEYFGLFGDLLEASCVVWDESCPALMEVAV